ncbi:unnamed protein product [Clonostachys byssicola]|uniref:Uncharacterized protein n=1 Tax=Clonostachys byssicola TaxID=160290 RepID=A0A9N9U328_9HYPO|nr:unnamed protein product [Clonostachys byssicola]
MNQWPSETPLNLCLEVIKPLWYPFHLIFEHLLHPVWSHLYPLSAYHEERREQTRLKAAAQRLDDEFTQLQVKNHRPIPATKTPTYPSGPLFTKVPFDIRRQILIEAFGAQTVHLDLDVVERTRGQCKVKSWQWMNSKGWIYRTKPSIGDILFTGKRREILSHALEARVDPHTQGNVLEIVMLVLQVGYYRVGKREFTPFSFEILGSQSSEALIRISACSYEECIEVLYRTNTIHIESLSLLRGMHEFVAPYKMTLITSFAMTISPNLMIFDEIFAGLSPKACPNPFRFPSLARLHLICGIKYSLVYLIDRLVRRIASSRTEVNVFCASWEVYTAVDLSLAENQGVDKTKLHWADVGGLRCWREMAPKEEVDSDASPRGYWIHLSSQLMPSDHGDFVCDGRRIGLYNLRDHEHRLQNKLINVSEAEEDSGPGSF